MKHYDSYKDSGVEWIGQVPRHWRLRRLKFSVSHSNAGVWGDEEKGDSNDILCYRIADFNYQKGILKNEGLTIRNIVENHLSGRILTKGDLLIEKSGGGESTPVGRVVRFDKNERATCSNFIHFISISEDENNKFFYYYFNYLYSNKVNLLFFNQTTGIQNLKVGEYLSQYIFLPSSYEQGKIVEYLDEKCGEVDDAIAVQTRRIELLEELKQSTITRAVTRGLDQNVPMRPSGVDWIGNIPEHWETKRLRFICEVRNGYTPSKQVVEFWTDGTIPWYRMEDIRESGRRLNEAKQYITETAVKGAGLFEAGSFILATTATIGEHAMLIVDSLANQRFTNLKIRKSLISTLDREFFFQYLFAIDDYCKTTTNTATFPAVNMTDLLNFPVCLPPIEEQHTIVAYLDSECSRIDAKITSAKRKIELLQEYKQSLITEVVTGKRKVC